MSYWYVAHENELLIDLDDYMRPTRTGCPWGEAFFRRRLRDAVNAGKLPVHSVWLLRSHSDKHYHAIIELSQRMPTLQRLIWQMHLGSDLYRSRADLMRYALGKQFPSLLILPAPFVNYREADYFCECERKHDTEEQFSLGENACQTWKKLRSMSPWELFGPSPKRNERVIPLPLGYVPMCEIRRMEEECQK